jgi:hypothetical protein
MAKKCQQEQWQENPRDTKKIGSTLFPSNAADKSANPLGRG